MGAGCCKSSVGDQPNVKKIAVKPQVSKSAQQNGHVLDQEDGEDEFIEAAVCHENDIGENEMKNFDIGSTKVLVIKQKGEISAIGAKCSHYGALLSMGALGDGRVRCPWHGACFNIKTGDIEDYPGQDSIPCYQVKVEQGQVRIRAKKSALKSYKRHPVKIGRDLLNSETYVVIGGGPSGTICVENLRSNGFSGRIVFVCKETYLPYDRVKVSKAMDADIESILLRQASFYDDYDIEVLLGVAATGLNSETKQISLSNGESLKYDKVYIATGISPSKLDVPGINLKNIITLRDFHESKYVVERLNKDAHVVCVGVSFTGMEAAAFCVKKVAKVTVIGRDTIPFRHSFGAEVGGAIMKFFKDHKVEFEMKNGVKRCISNDKGEIECIELNDSRLLSCNLLILACGGYLNTDFLKDSGIYINQNGSIDTDEYLQTNVEGVYVGGDIANSPIYMTGKNESIGHYPLAQYHGKIAAVNMCGIPRKLQAVPFFWTMLFGRSFRYAGHGKPHEVRIEGNLEMLRFVAFYFDDMGQVIAMSSCGRDPVVAQYAELLSQGRYLMKSDIEEDPFAWTKDIAVSTCKWDPDSK